MTCEEFQTITKTQDVPDVTRAQRALMLRHFNECPACQSFIWSGQSKKSSVDPDEIDKIADRDAEDPEFREVSGGFQ